jgi:type I restriction enzyme S subunit
MEVRHGYKQTEVGVIPEVWGTPQLGDILKSTQLGGNYKNNERETNWRLIKMGNLSRGTINLDKLEFIDPSQPPASRDRLRADDVLFNTRNTLDLVGKVALWRDELPEAYFNSNIMRMEFDETRVSSKRFVNYMLNTSQSLKSLRGIAIGTTSVAAIYSRDLVKVTLTLPTKAEQEAIAEALSDADALIESLDQLIAKKRHIKQGAMQELLTGKKRLPGFSGEWETSRFDGVLSRVNVKAHQIQASDYQTTGRYPVVDQGKEPVIGFSDRHDKRFACPQGGVIVFGDHTCIVKFVEFDFLVGADGTQVLRAKGGQCTRFHALHLQYKGVQPTGYNRHFKFLKEREFVTPPLPEQTTIAAILSDMDAEIEVMEEKLAKTRQIKQGMMQELLTGRIRLI